MSLRRWATPNALLPSINTQRLGTTVSCGTLLCWGLPTTLAPQKSGTGRSAGTRAVALDSYAREVTE